MASDTIIEVGDAIIFQQEHLVLSDVSFTVKKGEFVYLIGKTGSGKSSLLRMLYRDLKLKQGTCKIAGFQIEKIKKKQIPFLRRKLGIIFQDFQLLHDRTVDENLFFVMRATGWKEKSIMKKCASEALEKVGLATKGFKMPHELSGGEQQRLAIARALINNPDVIIADEPTGNLDPETSEGILKLLFDIKNSGRAVLMATHNFSVIQKFPSRILKCENGTVMESDPAGIR